MNNINIKIKGCDEFQSLGNVTHANTITIENCPNFTDLGSLQTAPGGVRIKRCWNFQHPTLEENRTQNRQFHITNTVQ